MCRSAQRAGSLQLRATCQPPIPSASKWRICAGELTGGGVRPAPRLGSSFSSIRGFLLALSSI
eukprot:1718894-Pleurochrysis_carterae.AAC.1